MDNCISITKLPKRPNAGMIDDDKSIRCDDGGMTAKVITISVRDLGYSVFWNVFNTTVHTDIHQNRERTYMIGFKDEADWDCEPNKKTSSSIFNSHLPLAKSKTKKKFREMLESGEVEERYYYKQDSYMYKDLKKSINSKDTAYQWRRVYVRENKSNECPTLTANMGTGGHNVPLIKDDLGIRKLTPRECLNFQGFPKSFKFPDDMPVSQRYKQVGNAVTVTLIAKIAKIISKKAPNVWKASMLTMDKTQSLEIIKKEKTFKDEPKLTKEIIINSPSILRQNQSEFSKTGGIHASGLFSSVGKLISLREDVGRHNALDKIIGDVLNKNKIDPKNQFITCSGRLNFELVQKVLMTNIGLMIGVGAPTSLAIDLANRFDMTLIGFVKEDSFNIYTNNQKVIVN